MTNNLSNKQGSEILIFKMTGWILFLIIIASLFGGAMYFYFAGWLTVNTSLPVPKIDLPINMPLWQKILTEINQRSGTPPEFKNIF